MYHSNFKPCYNLLKTGLKYTYLMPLTGWKYTYLMPSFHHQDNHFDTVGYKANFLQCDVLALLQNVITQDEAMKLCWTEITTNSLSWKHMSNQKPLLPPKCQDVLLLLPGTSVLQMWSGTSLLAWHTAVRHSSVSNLPSNPFMLVFSCL